MIIVMENLRETLARNLTRLIEASDLSVKEIARRIGVTDVSIHRWKSGANPPDVGNMDALAKVLGVDPMEFYRSEGAHIVTMKPSVALKKYLVLPDEIVEDLCQFGPESNVWVNIRHAIELEKKVASLQKNQPG